MASVRIAGCRDGCHPRPKRSVRSANFSAAGISEAGYRASELSERVGFEAYVSLYKLHRGGRVDRARTDPAGDGTGAPTRCHSPRDRINPDGRNRKSRLAGSLRQPAPLRIGPGWPDGTRNTPPCSDFCVFLMRRCRDLKRTRQSDRMEAWQNPQPTNWRKRSPY